MYRLYLVDKNELITHEHPDRAPYKVNDNVYLVNTIEDSDVPGIRISVNDIFYNAAMEYLLHEYSIHFVTGGIMISDKNDEYMVAYNDGRFSFSDKVDIDAFILPIARAYVEHGVHCELCGGAFDMEDFSNISVVKNYGEGRDYFTVHTSCGETIDIV